MMCLATEIIQNNAYCEICHQPATENQRLKKIGKKENIPADYNDPIVQVGGDGRDKIEYYYKPRCIQDWELPGAPRLKYEKFYKEIKFRGLKK